MLNIQRFQEFTGDSDSNWVTEKEINKGPRTKNRNIKKNNTNKKNNMILTKEFINMVKLS